MTDRLVNEIMTANGPAILAELRGEWWLEADAAALATIDQPRGRPLTPSIEAAAPTHQER